MDEEFGNHERQLGGTFFLYSEGTGIESVLTKSWEILLSTPDRA
jgi:hypothetical protein